MSALAAVAAPALAQAPDAPRGAYANIGYANFDAGAANLDALQGRLGYRFNTWLGVEAEFAGGVKNDQSGGIRYKLNHSEAIYGVGFLPLSPKWDLIGRIGYGHTKLTASIPNVGFGTSWGEDHWNFGAGAQYHFDGRNGVRADYTRQAYQGGGDANVWSVAYSRGF
jgi:hypothetical protein